LNRYCHASQTEIDQKESLRQAVVAGGLISGPKDVITNPVTASKAVHRHPRLCQGRPAENNIRNKRNTKADLLLKKVDFKWTMG
ncbi:MAG: hypothetical protein AAFV72_07260, partial [Cyanobacteria bacterium J06635_1]